MNINPYRVKIQSVFAHILQSNFTHYTVLFFILISIFAVFAASFDEMEEYKLYLFGINYISSFVFLLEFIARIWVAPLSYPKSKAVVARLKYTFSFYGLVDFVAVLPCVLVYFCWDTEAVNLIVLPYIFIIFKLIRHSKSFQIIGKALYTVREELRAAYTACFIMLCFSAVLMYYIERNAQPDVFRNIGDGFWWSLVTFTTVGYGDIYPVTPIGKLLSCVICMVGIGMIAIPTGIISSSFVNIVQQKERKAREIRETANEHSKTKEEAESVDADEKSPSSLSHHE